MAYIFNQHSCLREAVKGVVESHGIKAEVWKGQRRFIGAETREEGRRAFDRIIPDYEAARPLRGRVRGRDLSGHAGRRHRRAGQAKALTATGRRTQR
jgi:hypothetical protein